MMKLVMTLMVRIGFLGRKAEAPDIFDLRLTRIGAREQRCAGRIGGLFAGPARRGEI